MKILVAGATGFLGSNLCPRLRLRGHEVVGLARHDDEIPGVERTLLWDGKTTGDWVEELDGADALINLSGRSVAAKWTDEVKKELYDSRIGTTEFLAEAYRLVAAPPKVWINMSGVGYYRPFVEEPLDESGPKAESFMGDLCANWEHAILEADLPETRRVVFRTAPVLGPGGGAYEVFVKLVRWFLGGSAGSGRQWVSWIHLEDMLRLFEWVLASSEREGAYNAVSPEPVRNRDFMAALRKAHGRPWSPPAPEFAIKLFGKIFGPDPSLALEGLRIVPGRALKEDFDFLFPTLSEALRDLTASR